MNINTHIHTPHTHTRTHTLMWPWYACTHHSNVVVLHHVLVCVQINEHIYTHTYKYIYIYIHIYIYKYISQHQQNKKCMWRMTSMCPARQCWCNVKYVYVHIYITFVLLCFIPFSSHRNLFIHTLSSQSPSHRNYPLHGHYYISLFCKLWSLL